MEARKEPRWNTKAVGRELELVADNTELELTADNTELGYYNL